MKNLFLVLSFLTLITTACASEEKSGQKPKNETTQESTAGKQERQLDQKDASPKRESKFGKGLKKVGRDIEQAFDRMSKKDKDGDGE